MAPRGMGEVHGVTVGEHVRGVVAAMDQGSAGRFGIVIGVGVGIVVEIMIRAGIGVRIRVGIHVGVGVNVGIGIDIGIRVHVGIGIHVRVGVAEGDPGEDEQAQVKKCQYEWHDEDQVPPGE
jgi:hypothetical protein